MTHPDLAQRLIDRQTADLSLRDDLIRRGELEGGYHPAMKAVHETNADALAAIIADTGYPTISQVGEAANDAAWLIVQHAISRPDFMRSCCSLLEAAVAAGEARPVHLAYLTDRIAVFSGVPQRYGTQFDLDADGQLSPNAYDDRALVDQRRAALGMNSLAERTVEMRREYSERQSEIDGEP